MAAKEHGLPLLVGARLELEDGPPLSLYALSREGYGGLSSLITVGRRRAPKGSYQLTLRDVLGAPADELAVVVLAEEGSPALGELREAFGERAYLGVTLLRGV